eukprot:c15292_g1_i1 orf=263-856(+)
MQGRGMASMCLFWALALMVGYGAQAAQLQVGGPAGWTLPSIANVNYTDWSASQTFVVGDTLYFNYSKEYHNVMVVKKVDYEGCEASSPISTFDDGATLITLDRSGTFYFLCGVPEHCADGQKVAVRVRKHVHLSSSPTTSPQQSIISPSPTTSPSPINFPPFASMNDNNSAPPPSFSLGFLILATYLLFYSHLIFSS